MIELDHIIKALEQSSSELAAVCTAVCWRASQQGLKGCNVFSQTLQHRVASDLHGDDLRSGHCLWIRCCRWPLIVMGLYARLPAISDHDLSGSTQLMGRVMVLTCGVQIVTGSRRGGA